MSRHRQGAKAYVIAASQVATLRVAITVLTSSLPLPPSPTFLPPSLTLPPQLLAAPAIIGVLMVNSPTASYGLLFIAYVTAETWLGPAAALVQVKGKEREMEGKRIRERNK